MTLVKNKKEFLKLWPYESGKPSIFPTHYPCLAEYVYNTGGLGGSYYELSVVYIPKNVDVKSFIAGVNAASYGMGIQ